MQYPCRLTWLHLPHSLAAFLFGLAYVAVAVAATLHALLTKPDPRSALSWMSVAWLIPFGGPLLYWLFGINRVRRSRTGAAWRELTRAGSMDDGVACRPDLARVTATLTGRPLASCNQLEPLDNGEVAFPKHAARYRRGSHFCVAGYVYLPDGSDGETVRAGPGGANRRGVQVRVLVDGIGEWYDWPHVVPLLRQVGVKSARFLAPRLFPPNLSLNCRNHRKILVVDGQSGFMGGMNIGGREVGGATGRRTSDMHFLLRARSCYSSPRPSQRIGCSRRTRCSPPPRCSLPSANPRAV